MGHRINEKNIGNSTLESIVAMEEDQITGTYTDGGRITLSLTGEQMYDLFEAKRKLNG